MNVYPGCHFVGVLVCCDVRLLNTRASGGVWPLADEHRHHLPSQASLQRPQILV